MAAESMRITSASLEAALLQTATIRDGHDVGSLFSERLGYNNEAAAHARRSAAWRSNQSKHDCRKSLETGFGLVSIASRVPARSDRSTIHGVGKTPSFFWLIDKNMKT